MVYERVVSSPNPPMSHEVLYIGSAVPLETSEGLEAVQQPLRARYPVDNDETIQGVIATLVVVPEGIQLRFQGENSPPILFLFSSLSMCAAVRCVKTTHPTTGVTTSRFVSLSSPEAGGVNSSRPAIFTAITRRTKGRQVLECHGFVTNMPKDALDLVQWTAALDQRSKNGGGPSFAGSSSTVGAAGGGGGNYATMSAGDMSFRASDTSSLPDFPIQIKPADPVINNNAMPAPGSFQEPSKDGYFYSTKNTQVKRYSLQRFQGNTGVDDTPSVIGAGADQFVRRPAAPAYAASNVSAPATSHHHQQHHHHQSNQQQHQHHHHQQVAGSPAMFGPPMMVPVGMRPPPMMVPVRAVRPPPPHGTLMRPVFVGDGPPPPVYMYPRAPRFFSPPPPLLRARPVPMYAVPPPPLAGEFATLPRPGRAGRRGSRGDSSHSSSDRHSTPSPSPGANAKMNGKAGGGAAVTKKNSHNQDRGGATSDDSSSRPQTPPTDYEGAPRGPRVSRREDFLMRERNGYTTGPPPPGMYVMPPYSFYPPPPGTYDRARSQPPFYRNASSKSKKKEKKSSAKKSGKSSAKNGGGSRHHHYYLRDPYDTADTMEGYHSEMLTGSKANAENRAPRDFRRMENQFQHERAFSKSLAEETRKSTRGEPEMTNAYSLNNVAAAVPEVVPAGGARDGPVARDPGGFPMY